MLRIDEPVLTPLGFRPMGELKVGDEVFDERGKVQKVLWESEVRDDMPAYKLSFCNGETIEACSEHQWFTWTKRDRKNHNRGLSFNPSVKTTEEIYNSQKNGKEFNHSIPYTKPIELPSQKFPLDPYLLGLWLGDGHKDSGAYSTQDMEILDAFRTAGHIITDRSNCTYYILGLIPKLREVGVLGNKHIPNDYLMGGKEQRLALLQGLMDSDGEMDSKGSYCEFGNTNKQMADGVAFLVASLGMKTTRSQRQGRYRKKDGEIQECQICYRVRFRPYMKVFRLKRHLARYISESCKAQHHTIKKVEKCESSPMKCISVSGISSLYLAGKSLIPTHNSSIAIYFAWKFAVLFPESEVYVVLDEAQHGRLIYWANGRLPRFFSTQPRLPGEKSDAYKRRRVQGKAIEQKYLAGEPNSTTMTMRFKNNSTIGIMGSLNFAQADGLSPAAAVYDEIKSHRPEFDTAFRPNLDALNGRLLVVGTPPPEGQALHYIKMEEEFKRSKRKRHFLMPSYLNELIYPGGRYGEKFLRIENDYKMAGNGHVFKREYLGIIVPDATNAVFPDLDRRKHVFPHAALMEELENSYKDWDYYMTYDPGSVTVFATTIVAINRKDKRFWVLGELYETQQKRMTVGHLFPLSREKAEEIHQFFEDWILTYDAAAAWFANEVATIYDVGMLPCDKTSRKGEGKQDQLMVLRSAIKTGRFAMSDRCTHTYKEMISYSRDEDTGKLPKKNDHAIDCLRYTMRTAAYDEEEFSPHEQIQTFQRIAYSVDDDWSREYNRA